jgi:hypothetical protein
LGKVAKPRISPPVGQLDEEEQMRRMTQMLRYLLRGQLTLLLRVEAFAKEPLIYTVASLRPASEKRV